LSTCPRMTAEPFWPGDRAPLYQAGTAKFVGTFTVPFLFSVTTLRGTERPIIGIVRCVGRDRGIGLATRVGGGDFECATSRDERPVAGIVVTVAARLDAGLTVVVVAVVAVVVVVAAETAGVTSIVVVVGEGMTTPEEGSETTPKEEVRVGPWG
jgi:hypothetical protein